MNPYVVLNEKNEGDEKIVRSHLEDLAIDCSSYSNTMIITDYGFNNYKPGELTIYLEPLQQTDGPADYYVIMEGSKRKISYFCSHKGKLSEVVIEPKGWRKKGKHTRLFIRSKRKRGEEKR